MKKYLGLKIFLSLVPALILLQNWGWMSANQIIGIAFLAFWLLCIWIVLRIEDKNKIISQLLRISEIGLFLLPISALVLTFVIGAEAVESTSGATQAGAAIGVAIGGMMAVVLGFMIGVAGGIIMHVLANKFEKKITDKSETKTTNWFERHKAVTIILLVVALITIASSKSDAKKAAVTQEQAQTEEAQKEEDAKPKEPSPIAVEQITITKDSIGTPEANAVFKNTSKKEIDAVKARIKTFNNFDEPVNGFLTENTFEAISQDKIPAGKSKAVTWALYNFDGTTKVKFEVYHVHFTDGTTWEE